MQVGIELMNVYAGLARIPVPSLFKGRNLDDGRLGNLMMRDRAIALPCEDPITNAVNAAKPIIDALTESERNQIEVLITSTESGVDYSKSIASYVHEYLGLSRNCRMFETKQACYSATGALQMGVGYIASGVSPGAKVLVIGTDVSLVDARAEYMEPAVGTGASAVLLSDKPRVLSLDLGAFGIYSFETMDSARPRYDYEVADVDGSLFTYLDCLGKSFENYASRVEGVSFVDSFQHLAMHTPFAGLVKAAHRRMMRSSGVTDRDAVAADFERRVAASVRYPSVVGNLCSASLYLALSSLVDCGRIAQPQRVGLFSYGSGCASEFFSGIVDDNSVQALAPMQIGAHLECRKELTFEEYLVLLRENLDCLRPVASRRLDPERFDGYVEHASLGRKMLMLKEIKDYHRQYEWR